MRKIALSICLIILLSLAVLPGLAQDDPQSQPATSEYLMALRPLGRIRIEGGQVTHSPDGYHIATIRTILLPPIFYNIRPDATPTDIPTNIPPREEQNTAPIPLYWLNMWDIRGGNLMWSLRLPIFHNLDGFRFSPQGDSLFVRLSERENSEKIRLRFFETETGNIISDIEDLDVIKTPIIPGNIPQNLTVEAAYTPTGEYVIANYWRAAESPRCVLWRVADAQLVWEQRAACGTINRDGRFMVRPEPHANSFSAYNQLTVYDLPTGEIFTASEDEVVAHDWIDETHLLLHRPYGDAPVIWDIINDTRAIIEQPYRLDRGFSPYPLQNMLLNANFIWSKTTGGLLETLEEPPGRLIEVDGRILELYTDPEWREKEPEERLAGFVAYDFLTGVEVWHNEWQHSTNFLFSPDRHLALTVDSTTNFLEMFNLQTGLIEGELPTLYGNFTFTPQWDWLYQTEGLVYTVWGPPSELDRFSKADQPNGLLREDTRLFNYPNLPYSSSAGKLRRGEYVWAIGHAGGRWVLIEMANSQRYWVESGKVKTFDHLPNLPMMTN